MAGGWGSTQHLVKDSVSSNLKGMKMDEKQMDELDRLIFEVSNASFYCGEHDSEDDDEGYEALLDQAHSKEEELRMFVRGLFK